MLRKALLIAQLKLKMIAVAKFYFIHKNHRVASRRHDSFMECSRIARRTTPAKLIITQFCRAVIYLLLALRPSSLCTLAFTQMHHRDFKVNFIFIEKHNCRHKQLARDVIKLVKVSSMLIINYNY